MRVKLDARKNENNVKWGVIEHLGHIHSQAFSRTWWPQFLVFVPNFVSLFMPSTSKMVKNNKQDKNKTLLHSWCLDPNYCMPKPSNKYCILLFKKNKIKSNLFIQNIDQLKALKARSYLWSSGQSKPQRLRWHQRLGLAGFLCRRPCHLPLVHSGTSSHLFYVPKIQQECMLVKFQPGPVIKSTVTFSNGQQNVNFPAHFLH